MSAGLGAVVLAATSVATTSLVSPHPVRGAGTTTLLFDGNGGPVVGNLSDPDADRALTGDTVVEIAADLQVDALVVGGGGSGAPGGGGGGGAVCEKVAPNGAITLAPGTHTVTVGGGGGIGDGKGRGGSGGASALAGITAPGGGGGAGGYTQGATAGGSGGGGSGRWAATVQGASSVALGTDCFGNSGGSGQLTSSGSGATSGGGGGAGGAGSAGTGSGASGQTWTSGSGGSGRLSVITGGTYGGGGGGGSLNNSKPGSGGSGGGGSGSTTSGSPGTGNTGGGGGGGKMDEASGQSPGGAGGSGVVVVRIPVSIPENVITGQNSTTVQDDYRLYWFTASGTMTVTRNPNALVAHDGVISGSGNLIVDGPGQLALTAANTFTGAARARSASATLRMQHGDALQNATLDMRSSDAGAVAFDGADTEYRVAGLTGTRNLALNNKTLHVAQGSGVSNTYTGVLSGGSLRTSGNATLILTGANTLTSTTIDAGALQVGDGGASGTLGSGAVTNSASLVIDRSGTLTSSNAIGGTGSLTKRGTGTLVLTGASTYSGPTAVEAGALRVNGSLGSSTVTLQSGTTLSGTGSLAGPVTLSTGARHTPGTSPGVQTFGGGVSYQTGSTVQWELTGNTTSGRGTAFDGVDVTGGVLSVGAGVASELVFNGAGSSVNWTDPFWSQDHVWTVFDNASTPTLASPDVFDTVTITPDSGGRSLATEQPRAFFRWATSGDDVVLEYWAPRPLLAGAHLEIVADNDPNKGGESTHWDVIDGVLYLYDAAGRDPADMVVRISATDLEAKLAAGDVRAEAVSLAGSQPLELPVGRTLTVSLSAASTYNGVLSGGGGVTKEGTATLTLSGANTHTGPTTVVAGTLTAGSSTAFGTGAVTVTAGATLDVAGHVVGNDVAAGGAGVAGAGAVANSGPGAGGLTGSVTLTDTTTMRGPSALTIGGPVSGAHALTIGTSSDSAVTVAAPITVDGPLTLGSASVSLDDAVTVSGGRVIIDGGSPSATALSATPAASITASELLIRDIAEVHLGAPAEMAVTTVAATGVGRIALNNATGLTVGSVAGVSGVVASGRVELSTVTGDLHVTEAVTSQLSTSRTGIRLAAGTATPVGVPSGGDVVVTGQGSVDAPDAVVEILTGSASTSTGAAGLATDSRVGTAPPAVGVGEVAVAYRHADPAFISPTTMTAGESLTLLAVTATGEPASYVLVSGPCSLTGDVVEGSSAGTCVVEASDSVGATTQQSITVDPVAQHLEFLTAPPAQVTAGTTHTPRASATSGLPVTIDIASGDPQACSLTGGVVTFTGTGTCVIRARQAGDATVGAAPELTQTVVAGRTNRSITFDALEDRTIGTPPFIVGATVSAGAPVTYTTATPTVCSVDEDTGRVSLLDAGTCTVTATSAGDTQLADATRSRSFEVHPESPGRAVITAVTPGDRRVTVGFVPPSHDGGSPVVRHRIVATPHPDDGGQPVVRYCPETSPCTLDGLDNGTRYTFTVTAVNAAGPGVTSLASPEVVPSTTSTAVRNLTTVPGDGTLRVDFEPPTSLSGGTFVRYEVWRREPGNAWVGPEALTDADASTHTFTRLDNGSSYDVRVVTITSTMSTAVAANTATAFGGTLGAPEAPRGLVLTMLSPTSFTATWAAPLGDGGSPVTSYAVTPTCVFERPTDTYCLFTDQPRGVVINVAVAGVNLVGAGEAATESITLPAPPPPPAPPVTPTTPPVTPTTPTEPITPPITSDTAEAESNPGAPDTDGDNTDGNDVRPAENPSSDDPAPDGPVTAGRPTPNDVTVPTTVPTRPPASPPVTEFAPGDEPRALIGGRPVTLQTATRDGGVFELAVGDVRLSFQSPTTDGPRSSGLVAVEGRGTPLSGDGLRPNSTLRVLLSGVPAAPGWSSSSGPLSLARIPVAADGTFAGEMTLSTTVDQPPVPIGRHVVQLVAVDADGNEILVETTINVAQHAPRPELDRSAGRAPSPAPGELVATAAGLPTGVQVMTTPDGRGLTADGGDWSLGLEAGDSRNRIEQGDSGTMVTLVQAGTFTASGSGLEVGSRADIWMFSEPTLLGSATVDADGRFSVDLVVDPNFVEPGDHTLQVQGIAPDGYVRSVSLGVTVDAATDAAAVAPTDTAAVAAAGVPATGDLTPLLVLVSGVLIAGGILWFAMWRRRQDEEDDTVIA